MLMAVMERTREIGMLMSFGMKAREIVTLIVIEGMAIGAAGGFIGAVLGSIITIILHHTGIPLGSEIENIPIPIGDKLQVQFVPWAVPAAFFLGLVLSVIASLWPARRAAKLDPADALRSV